MLRPLRDSPFCRADPPSRPARVRSDGTFLLHSPLKGLSTPLAGGPGATLSCTSVTVGQEGGVLLLVIGHWLWYWSGCRRWGGGPAPVAMVVAALRDGLRNGCRGVPRCAPRRRSQWNADRTDARRQTPRFIPHYFFRFWCKTIQNSPL